MTSAREFVDGLVERALAHDAVHHPFLTRLAEGTLPDIPGVLKALAFQWREFGRFYPRFVRTVLRQLENEGHRAVFMRILAQEMGVGETQSHTDAFNVFAAAVGANADYAACHRVVPEAEVWASSTFKLCNAPNPAVGVGAIGIAGDVIVPAVYRQILSGIERYTDLEDPAKLFFSRHIEQSEARREDLLGVARDLAAREEDRVLMGNAVLGALDLRARFWRALLMISLASTATQAERAAG